MKKLLLAIQFLTMIPIKIKGVSEKTLSGSVIYFPFVGLMLGMVLVGLNNFLFILNFSEFTVNIALIILLIALTGGIHLDGLADSADALLSRKNKDDMLMIMRDSHIGAMGVLSLISVILLKIAFLSSINITLKTNSLLLMCMLSRWSMVLAMFLFPYARKEGKAKIYMEGMNLKIFILSTVFTLILTFMIWRVQGLLVLLIITISSYILGRFMNRKIGGITGDTIGAINELMEIVTLLAVCVMSRGIYG